jgi:glycosyltransferase involved in cell wall biosynthesis
MRVLLLSDHPRLNQGKPWIVDRIADRMIQGMPSISFTKDHHRTLQGKKFVRLANQHDLTHILNADIGDKKRLLDQIKKPVLVSVRSHRVAEDAQEYRQKVYLHVLNDELAAEFPEAWYIPDGIFEMFRLARPFTVGFAGRDDEYKGCELIRQACVEEKVNFLPALREIPPEAMPDYYRKLDLYVCASIAEGHSTPVCEAAASNVPIASVKTGFGSRFAQYIIPERTVKAIRTAIRFFNTASHAKLYYWERVLPQFVDLYELLAKRGPKR